MNRTVNKLSIFIFIVPAMTTLVIGTATTFAASNTHLQHYTQQIGNDDDWTSSLTHPPYLSSTGGSDDLGSLGYTQYGSGSHRQHDHSSTDMIAAIDGDNSNSTASNLEPSSFSSTEYAWNHAHHHHNNNNNMIVDIN